MNVAAATGRTGIVGGPLVLHSPWWIRGHWGRAFDIVELHPDRLPARPPIARVGHGVVVAKPRAVHAERRRPDRAGGRSAGSRRAASQRHPASARGAAGLPAAARAGGGDAHQIAQHVRVDREPARDASATCNPAHLLLDVRTRRRSTLCGRESGRLQGCLRDRSPRGGFRSAQQARASRRVPSA